MTVTLTGYMGSGKSSVGRVLSALLSLPLVDLDAYIEDKEGRSVNRIFAEDGENAFRRMEEEALRELLVPGKDMVLSLGGGTVMTPSCAALVKGHSTCFYLKASVETLVSHLKTSHTRPLLEDGPDRDKIRSMLETRGPVYEQVCDYIVDVDNQGVKRTAQDIASILQGSL